MGLYINMAPLGGLYISYNKIIYILPDNKTFSLLQKDGR